mmetsp:Transcript_7447/g.12975  ORF Transcript_7447/g.12975 Transcript_7447/m.12975 type:complete len:330 (-) Transcript_7447:224-1213(-)
MACPLKKQYHFPFKLYSMLQYAADSEYSSALGWIEEGRAFAIRNKDTFLKHIVPMFFKQTKFRSFTRQLNLWGFTRLSNDGPDGGSWKHAHFVCGRVERLGSIERNEVKNSKPRTETRKPKNSKPNQRRNTRTTRKARRTAARVISLAESTGDSISSVADGTIVPPRPPILNAATAPTVTFPENAQIQPVIQPLTSSTQFRSLFQPETIWSASASGGPCHPPPISPSTCLMDGSQFQFQTSPTTNQSSFNHSSMDDSQPQPMPSFDGNNMTHVQCEHVVQPPVTRGTDVDDILFSLSGILESDESYRDNDLSSILSNESCEDFMNPMSF